MSVSKQAGVVGTVKSGMIVGGKHRRYRLHQKAWTLAVVGVVLVVGVIWGVVAATTAKTVQTPPSPTGKVATSAQAAYNSAFIQSLNGKPTTLQSLLDKQLTTATSPDQKVSIYDQKIAAALNANEYEQAISMGAQADAIKPTSQTAGLIANAYQGQGNIPEAKVWLQNAINRLPKSDPLYGRDLRSYQSQLAALGS
jgi:tetratricopeptide (TPR) repeat protein